MEDYVEVQNDFDIYPNPFNGVFAINNSEEIQTIEIYNISGQKIPVQLMNNKLILSCQLKGVYLLRVELNNGAVVSKKLMKL